MEEEKKENKIVLPPPPPVIIRSTEQPEGIIVGFPDGKASKPKTTVKK